MGNVMTITEALAEIKTINARITKKRNEYPKYIVRDARIRDPLERDGGSEKYVREERQAIADLEERLIRIRLVIQNANHMSELTVEGVTRTVAEWLTWRREVAPNLKTNLASMLAIMQNARTQLSNAILTTQSAKAKSAAASGQPVLSMDPPPELAYAVNEKTVAEESEKLETILGTLDGRLSLFNATTSIDFSPRKAKAENLPVAAVEHIPDEPAKMEAPRTETGKSEEDMPF